MGGIQGYELTWNPNLSRINTDQDPETIKYIKYTMDKNNYYQVALSGFVFDTKPVATEVGKIKPKLQQTADILMTGWNRNGKNSPRNPIMNGVIWDWKPCVLKLSSKSRLTLMVAESNNRT